MGHVNATFLKLLAKKFVCNYSVYAQIMISCLCAPLPLLWQMSHFPRDLGQQKIRVEQLFFPFVSRHNINRRKKSSYSIQKLLEFVTIDHVKRKKKGDNKEIIFYSYEYALWTLWGHSASFLKIVAFGSFFVFWYNFQH